MRTTGTLYEVARHGFVRMLNRWLSPMFPLAIVVMLNLTGCATVYERPLLKEMTVFPLDGYANVIPVIGFKDQEPFGRFCEKFSGIAPNVKYKGFKADDVYAYFLDGRVKRWARLELSIGIVNNRDEPITICCDELRAILNPTKKNPTPSARFLYCHQIKSVGSSTIGGESGFAHASPYIQRAAEIATEQGFPLSASPDESPINPGDTIVVASKEAEWMSVGLQKNTDWRREDVILECPIKLSENSSSFMKLTLRFRVHLKSHLEFSPPVP